jgi:hypothetical protein
MRYHSKVLINVPPFAACRLDARDVGLAPNSE